MLAYSYYKFAPISNISNPVSKSPRCCVCDNSLCALAIKNSIKQKTIGNFKECIN